MEGKVVPVYAVKAYEGITPLIPNLVMDVSSEPLDLAALHPGKQPYIPRVWEAE
jgi:hypothetical protein